MYYKKQYTTLYGVGWCVGWFIDEEGGIWHVQAPSLYTLSAAKSLYLVLDQDMGYLALLSASTSPRQVDFMP